MSGFASRAALLACALAFGCAAAQALDVGDRSPRIELPGKGRSVSLPAADGTITYVDFWASWCGTCRQSFPWMNEMQRKYGAQGLRVVGVNLDAEARDAAAFLARMPAGFTVAYDPSGDSARRFGVVGMPTSVLLASDGTVLMRHSGFNAADREGLEEAIRKALGTTP